MDDIPDRVKWIKERLTDPKCGTETYRADVNEMLIEYYSLLNRLKDSKDENRNLSNMLSKTEEVLQWTMKHVPNIPANEEIYNHPAIKKIKGNKDKL